MGGSECMEMSEDVSEDDENTEGWKRASLQRLALPCSGHWTRDPQD